MSSPLRSFPYSPEDERKVNDVWLKGHTGMYVSAGLDYTDHLPYIDSTSVSILWSQPVPGLQVKSRKGEWRWVRHIENGVVSTLRLQSPSCSHINADCEYRGRYGNAIWRILQGRYPSGCAAAS